MKDICPFKQLLSNAESPCTKCYSSIFFLNQISNKMDPHLHSVMLKIGDGNSLGQCWRQPWNNIFDIGFIVLMLKISFFIFFSFLIKCWPRSAGLIFPLLILIILLLDSGFRAPCEMSSSKLQLNPAFISFCKVITSSGPGWEFLKEMSILLANIALLHFESISRKSHALSLNYEALKQQVNKEPDLVLNQITGLALESNVGWALVQLHPHFFFNFWFHSHLHANIKVVKNTILTWS